MHEFAGGSDIPGDTKFAIVVSKYNENITGKLLAGAIETLTAAGIGDDSITVAHVPGAWEIPIIAKKLLGRKQFAAIICLGAVIKGETTHDEHINRFVSMSLGEMSVAAGVPVLFGLLTCNTLDQAIHRSGGNVGNKGSECAEAAIEMVHLLNQLSR